MLGTEFCFTMNSESGNRKDANTSVPRADGAIVIAGVKGKADARMCVVCRGYKTHEEERVKGNFCACNRFSADGFRTRATRVIRWRVLGFGRPTGKPKEGERDVQVMPGRKPFHETQLRQGELQPHKSRSIAASLSCSSSHGSLRPKLSHGTPKLVERNAWS